jgi:hypothetical protein
LQGELTLEQGYWVTVQDRLSMDAGLVVIEFYGCSIALQDLRHVSSIVLRQPLVAAWPR